ncbi:MAG: phage baseplate assembly protein V [Synergistaceae bacterium]|nr:phage baseplate assembly protein V [Synergistaceae bacterium]
MSENKEAGSIGRFGYVSDYDPKRHMARIRFPDKGDLVSAWLPVAIPNSKKNKDESHLDIDEHVFCSMMGNGLETGVVLCSIYDDGNKPETGNQDIHCVKFEDGTAIQYDRKEHTLSISCVGDIEIIASGNISVVSGGNISNVGARIDLN